MRQNPAAEHYELFLNLAWSGMDMRAVVNRWQAKKDSMVRATFYVRVGKRLFDAAFAVAGLVVTSPLLLICAVAVRASSRGPIFFCQPRVGQDGSLFRIFKFRTMVVGADRVGERLTASGDSRITAAGSWLRKTKLDELPQLLNVLRGEMSLVGPRPEVPEYVATYSEEQRRILRMKPGLTGPTALALVDEEKILAAHPDSEAFYLQTLLPRKLHQDLAYCQAVSFSQDLKLILRTLARLLRVSRNPTVDVRS